MERAPSPNTLIYLCPSNYLLLPIEITRSLFICCQRWYTPITPAWHLGHKPDAWPRLWLTQKGKSWINMSPRLTSVVHNYIRIQILVKNNFFMTSFVSKWTGRAELFCAVTQDYQSESALPVHSTYNRELRFIAVWVKNLRTLLRFLWPPLHWQLRT